MPKSRNPALTAARTIRHEALHARLDTLITQVAAVAKTRPDQAAAPVVQALAADLLFEAGDFRPRGERRGLPAVAPDLAGLAAQLGQALAMLSAFEDANSAWDAAHKCRVWVLSNGTVRPLGSEHPEPVANPRDAYSDDEINVMRRKLEKHIALRERNIFEAGRRAALEGRDPTFGEAIAGMYPPRLLLPTRAAPRSRQVTGSAR